MIEKSQNASVIRDALSSFKIEDFELTASLHESLVSFFKSAHLNSKKVLIQAMTDEKIKELWINSLTVQDVFALMNLQDLVFD